MKNIHMLPTEKPSRLVIDTIENKLYYQPILHNKTVNVLTQHIYITSDEEIKEDDYYLGDDNHIYCLVTTVNSNGKKIILTTDQDLIKEGVQPIPNEFLEWFVKNPSCEEVEIEDWFNKILSCCRSKEECHCNKKRIIIPQEDPKPETLEEAAEKWVFETNGHKWSNNDDTAGDNYGSFIKGGNFMRERMYSEDEVKRIAFDFYYDISHKMNVPENLISENVTNVDEWFKQIKKS
jgi:hypothetical protein